MKSRQQRLLDQQSEIVSISFSSAALEVIKLVVPIVISCMASFGANRTVCMMVVGTHLPRHDIAIFGVGFSLYAAIGLTTPIGFGAAVDMLVAQAHGRKNEKEGGEWIQTALVFTMLLSIPAMIFFLFFAEPFLALFFEPVLAHDVSVFLKWTTPYVIIQGIGFILSRGLQAQKRAEIATYAALSGSAVCIISAFYFIPTYGVNFAAVCLTAALVVQLIVTFFVAVYDGTTMLTMVDTWNVFNFSYWSRIASYERLKTYAKLGRETWMSLASEWLGVESLSLMSAVLPESQIAGLGVVWIVITLFFNFGLSTSIASSSFVGFNLGANRPKHALFYSMVVQTISCGICILNSLFFTVAGRWWFSLFANDEETLYLIYKSITTVILFYNLEAHHISLQGIYRGCSAKAMRFTAVVVLVTFWFCGLPAAYLLGIKQPSFLGSLLDPGFANMLNGFALFGFLPEVAILTYYWLVKMDWSELALDASETEKKEENEEIVE